MLKKFFISKKYFVVTVILSMILFSLFIFPVIAGYTETDESSQIANEYIHDQYCEKNDCAHNYDMNDKEEYFEKVNYDDYKYTHYVDGFYVPSNEELSDELIEIIRQDLKKNFPKIMASNDNTKRGAHTFHNTYVYPWGNPQRVGCHMVETQNGYCHDCQVSFTDGRIVGRYHYGYNSTGCVLCSTFNCSSCGWVAP